MVASHGLPILPAVLRPLAVAWIGSFALLLGPITAGAYRSRELSIGLLLGIGVAVYLLTMRSSLVRMERNLALGAAALISAISIVRSIDRTTLDNHVSNLLLYLPILFVWFFALAITIHALARVAASLRRGPVAS